MAYLMAQYSKQLRQLHLVDKSVVHDDSFVLEETVNLMKKYDSYMLSVMRWQTSNQIVHQL